MDRTSWIEDEETDWGILKNGNRLFAVRLENHLRSAIEFVLQLERFEMLSNPLTRLSRLYRPSRFF